MEISDACMLSEGEDVIFDDGNIGRNKKLVLTNRRLIFLQSRGGSDNIYQKEDEISIEDVESARYDTELGAIVLQLKNGEKDVINFFLSESLDVLTGIDPEISEVKLQPIISNWLNEINRLALQAPKMICCEYCGAKNKSTETKCVNCGAIMP